MSNLTRIKTVLFAGVAAVGLFGAYAHYHTTTAEARPAATAAMPAVPVGIRVVKAQDIRLWSSYSGRLHAVDSADIRPEVSGRITELRFADGQTVKAGDILLVIDPRPYEASLAKAKANLAQARNNAELAKLQAQRAANLVKSEFVSRQVYDERINTQHVAEAVTKGAEADVRQAEIDLDHAYVKAPISGRLSRAEITVGNLVQAGANAPILTSIVSNDAIYADFEVDEQTYLKAIHGTTEKNRRFPVELALKGDGDYGVKGEIQSFDNKIDTASGTIRARARFVNRDGSLVPGMFVSVRMAGNQEGQALLVPERAIGNDQDKKFVYVVGEGEKVAYREIALGPQIQGQRVVVSGLQAGDRVIVDGLQHVRPDVPVQVSDVQVSSAR